MTSTLRIPALLFALLLALTVVACADDDDVALPASGPDEAQAGVSGELVASALSDVPVPSAAQDAGGLQEEDNRQTQAYIVTASTPEQVQEFYADELPANGWTFLDETTLPDGSRTTWLNEEGMQLIVAALAQDQDTDLSLQVTSSTTDIPTGPGED